MSCFMPGKSVRTVKDSHMVVAILSDGGTYTPSTSRCMSRQDADALAYSVSANHKCVEVRQRHDITLFSGIPYNRRAKVKTYPVLDEWTEWVTVHSFVSF